MMDEAIADLTRDWGRHSFAWGRRDCCTFAVDALRRLHGVHIDLPTYSTPDEARRALDAMGGMTQALLHAGLAPVGSVRQAVRGDLVMWDRPGHAVPEGLALVTGEHALAVGLSGLAPVPRRLWRSVWRVQKNG